MLASKLPNGLINRWNRTAYNIRKRQECEPSLSDLIEFMDPEAIEWYSERSEKPNHKRYRRVKSLAIETKTGDSPFFSARHDTEECDEFKKLSVNERSKVSFRKKLCYRCSQLNDDGHNSKTCTKRRKCRICNGKYPTKLHGLQLKKNDKGKSEKEIRKEEVVKADSTRLTYASTKMNQVISCVWYQLRFNLKDQTQRLEPGLCLITVVKEDL